MGFLGVYFSNTLERPDVFPDKDVLVESFSQPLVKFNVVLSISAQIDQRSYLLIILISDRICSSDRFLVVPPCGWGGCGYELVSIGD